MLDLVADWRCIAQGRMAPMEIVPTFDGLRDRPGGHVGPIGHAKPVGPSRRKAAFRQIRRWPRLIMARVRVHLLMPAHATKVCRLHQVWRLLQPRIVPASRGLQDAADRGYWISCLVHFRELEDAGGIEPISRAKRTAAFARSSCSGHTADYSRAAAE